MALGQVKSPVNAEVKDSRDDDGEEDVAVDPYLLNLRADRIKNDGLIHMPEPTGIECPIRQLKITNEMLTSFIMYRS